MLREHDLLPLFQKFIQNSFNGKRLNKNGTKIKTQTIENYSYTCKLLEGFSLEKNQRLMIHEVKGNNKREHFQLKKYYTNFYKSFTSYLYKEKNCFDNYVGQNIKHIRTFFNWVNNEAGIVTGPYYKSFYVRKEEIPITTLSVEQFHFLLYNSDFENSLSLPLQRTKDFFVFGCTVGLRFSDLSRLKKVHIEKRDAAFYLKVRSKKTATDTMVKLPEHAIRILKKYSKLKTSLLPSISLFRFNVNLKRIGELAGWTDPIPRYRTVRGIMHQSVKEKNIRFCDGLSSHAMRRTSITTMLTSGMPEHVVRKISGHTNDSKAFFRYVNLAQTLMDTEIEKMHDRLKEA